LQIQLRLSTKPSILAKNLMKDGYLKIARNLRLKD